MLGLLDGENLEFEPKIVGNTPWVMNLDTQIIFGKNSRGHIFQCL